MGVFYEMNGDLEVRNDVAILEIINRFNEEAGSDLEIEIMEHETFDKTVTLQFYGGVYCSYSTVEDIDSIAKELSPFVVKPGFINYECNGDAGKLYIGDPASESDSISGNALTDISELLNLLNEKDVNSLLMELLTKVKLVKPLI